MIPKPSLRPVKSGRFSYCLVIIVGYITGLLVANRPRFWWQELFHNLTLYWMVPAYTAAFWLLLRMWSIRRTSFPALVAVVGYLFAATYMGLRIVPYLCRSVPLIVEDSPRVSLRGVWIDSLTAQDDQGVIAERLLRYEPDVAISVGTNADILLDKFPRELYPFRVALGGNDLTRVQLVSRFPFGSDARPNLGLNALPGGVIPLILGNGKRVELGLLALQPSVDPVSFERNRISARRLSSLIRNSESSRIVAAYFHATPFSKLASVYPEEAKVRSIRAGQGLRATLRFANYASEESGFDVFVSKDVETNEGISIPIEARTRPGFFFRVSL